jgi:hydroxyacylglutathione hydrolase
MALKAAIVPVTPFQQNCTLLYDEDTKLGVVVDPGGDLDRIQDAIKKLDLTIEQIILTHGHIDHAAGADELREILKVKITGPHQADKFLLDGLVSQGAKFGFTAGVRNVTPDRWLDEGDKVMMAGVEFDIYHCPGHSPGSVVYVNKAAGVALVGDVLFQGSIGRTDFPYGDTEALISSVRNKLFPLGDEIVFVCGHGPASSFGQERQTNPFVGDGV